MNPSTKNQEPQPALSEPSGSTIYVVVLVSYDHYRFQDNLGASTSIETARSIAAAQAKERGYNEELPVIEDAEKSSQMDSGEERHIWIEAWPSNTEISNAPTSGRENYEK